MAAIVLVVNDQDKCQSQRLADGACGGNLGYGRPDDGQPSRARTSQPSRLASDCRPELFPASLTVTHAERHDEDPVSTITRPGTQTRRRCTVDNGSSQVESGQGPRLARPAARVLAPLRPRRLLRRSG